jgi:hypothetical protein
MRCKIAAWHLERVDLAKAGLWLETSSNSVAKHIGRRRLGKREEEWGYLVNLILLLNIVFLFHLKKQTENKKTGSTYMWQ